MALPASLVWECRPAGNDANGGAFDPSVASPGTDYSVQDAAQVTYADLVIGATTTQLTSAATPFTSAHVGNTLNVTGGTGFTTGPYNVRSVSGGVATMDRSVGTAASTGGVGKLGGALATPGMLSLRINNSTAGNVGFILYSATPYAVSATANVAGGSMTLTVACQVWGYSTTRAVGNQDALRPTLRASAGSTTIVYGQANGVAVGQLILDGNSQGATDGMNTLSRTRAHRVKAVNCRNGITFAGAGTIEECEASACANGLQVTATGGTIARSTAINCTTLGIVVGATSCVAVDCHAIGTSGVNFSLTSAGAMARNCTARGGTTTNGDGFRVGGAESLIVACRAWGNVGSGFNLVAADSTSRLVACAAGSNTAGNTSASWLASQVESLVALTADPDVLASGGNYAPNATAGGGALIRGVAAAYPGTSTTTYRDIGAAQAAASAAGGLRRTTFGGGY